MTEPKRGVMLLNLGGPDTMAAVRPFLYNLFSDREIIRLGPACMQKFLAFVISNLRASKSEGYYAQIGGGSPILNITNAQAKALENLLSAQGEIEVSVGMRYWHPYIEETALRIKAGGIKRLLGFSLYPQYSCTTSASSEGALRRALEGSDIALEFVPAWYDNPAYISALIETIKEGLQGGDAHVLFSAHSLPQSVIDSGDPYLEHIMGTIKSISAQIEMRWSLGFQSRSGPVKWLAPETGHELKRLAGEGVKDILVVPISFVSDHIETLYEIDILYKEMAGAMGMRLRRTASLNTRPQFIRALHGLALTRMKELEWV